METAKLKIKIGVDPEIFLVDTEVGRYCSAHGLVPGSKDAPHPLEKGACQLDGAAVEYNIKPAETSLEFVQNNTEVMQQLRKIIPQKYDFVFKPSIRFDEYYFDKFVPDDVKVLGCDPDFNVYTKSMNPPPKAKGSMRTGSGHIHIGWTEGKDINDPSHKYDCELVVKALEQTVGLFFKFWDDDKERSSLYGKPGAFRYKPYGVEWRSPSNAWLNHPELWPWLFDACVAVVESVHADEFSVSFVKGQHYTSEGLCYPTPLFKNADTALKHVKKLIPKFPDYPIKKEDKEQVKKDETIIYFSDGTPVPLTNKNSNSKHATAKRLAPTSSTTSFDINLDLPGVGQSDLPIPDYLLKGEQDINYSKGYGVSDNG